MRTVYILYTIDKYEGNEILGVFASYNAMQEYKSCNIDNMIETDYKQYEVIR